MSQTIIPGQQRADAIAGRLTFEQGRNRIIGRDENGFIRLIIFGDGQEFYMRITPPGVNVLDASDDNLVFNSDNNLFKILHTDTLEFTLDAADASAVSVTTESVDHSFSFVPGLFIFLEAPDGYSYPMPTYLNVITSVSGSNPGSVLFDSWIEGSVNIDDVTVVGVNPLQFERGPFQARYYLVQETSAPNPPMQSLTDAFNGTEIDRDKWLVFGEENVAVNNQLEITVEAGQTGVFGIISGDVSGAHHPYSLLGSHAFVELVDAGDQGLTNWQAYPVVCRLDDDNEVSFIVEDGNIHAVVVLGGVFNFQHTETYDPIDHRWLRIREDAGDIIWEVTDDPGSGWNSFYSENSPFAVTGLLALVQVNVTSAEATDSTMIVDNFNVGP